MRNDTWKRNRGNKHTSVNKQKFFWPTYVTSQRKNTNTQPYKECMPEVYRFSTSDWTVGDVPLFGYICSPISWYATAFHPLIEGHGASAFWRDTWSFLMHFPSPLHRWSCTHLASGIVKTIVACRHTYMALNKITQTCYDFLLRMFGQVLAEQRVAWIFSWTQGIYLMVNPARGIVALQRCNAVNPKVWRGWKTRLCLSY